MNHCQFIMFCHGLWISLRIYRSKPGILTAVANLFATLSSCLDSSNTKQVVQQKKSPVHETNPEPPGIHTNRTKSSSNILDCYRMRMDFPGFSSHPRNPSCSVALLALHAPPWLMAASTNLRVLSSQNASCAKRTLVARSRSCPQGEWLWLIHPEGMPQIHIWCHLRLKILSKDFLTHWFIFGWTWGWNLLVATNGHLLRPSQTMQRGTLIKSIEMGKSLHETGINVQATPQLGQVKHRVIHGYGE